MAPIAILTIPVRRDPQTSVFLLKISSLLIKEEEFFLALWGARVRGGVISIWPVKPFETVPVIKS